VFAGVSSPFRQEVVRSTAAVFRTADDHAFGREVENGDAPALYKIFCAEVPVDDCCGLETGHGGRWFCGGGVGFGAWVERLEDVLHGRHAIMFSSR
jgi:hypothetical protein